jgi:hypothetical protein
MSLFLIIRTVIIESKEAFALFCTKMSSNIVIKSEFLLHFVTEKRKKWLSFI